MPRGELGRETIPGGQARGFVAAERHGLGLGLVELLLAEAGARLVQAVRCADVAEGPAGLWPRRASPLSWRQAGR